MNLKLSEISVLQNPVCFCGNFRRVRFDHRDVYFVVFNEHAHFFEPKNIFTRTKQKTSNFDSLCKLLSKIRTIMHTTLTEKNSLIVTIFTTTSATSKVLNNERFCRFFTVTVSTQPSSESLLIVLRLSNAFPQ